MAAYVFETISATQAAAYVAAADSLSFQGAGATAGLVTVGYLGAEQIAVTMGGQTVNFGSGIYNETGVTFPNGSLLFIGGLAGDQILGGAFGDAVYGGQGDDTLSGAEGDDVLQGNQGADVLNGGPGNNTIYGGQGDDRIDLGAGVNFGQGNLGNDTVTAAASGPSILLGGQGDDLLIGGAGNGVLDGNLGNDSISGGSGAELISGSGGADTMDGGGGADTFTAPAGSSDVTLAGADRVMHWSSADLIDVAGPGGVAEYYQIPASIIATGGGGMSDPYGFGLDYDPTPPPMTGPVASTISFDQALSTSNSWLRGHANNNISTAQIPEGVAIFVDSNGDHVADISIILVGASIFDLSGANFI